METLHIFCHLLTFFFLIIFILTVSTYLSSNLSTVQTNRCYIRVSHKNKEATKDGGEAGKTTFRWKVIGFDGFS